VSKYLPTSALIVAGALVLIWLPIRWTKPGLAIYAVGSNRNAAYLAGIGVERTRIGAYALGGVFAAMGGLALTASSGIGDPNAGAIYTLNSVAAAVLGGVSLLGGVGGLIGPIAAAGILTLVKTILILRGENPNYAQVYQGAIIIVVVMLGGLVARRSARR
jgi:ribose transport system permease protein